MKKVIPILCRGTCSDEIDNHVAVFEDLQKGRLNFNKTKNQPFWSIPRLSVQTGKTRFVQALQQLCAHGRNMDLVLSKSKSNQHFICKLDKPVRNDDLVTLLRKAINDGQSHKTSSAKYCYNVAGKRSATTSTLSSSKLHN